LTNKEVVALAGHWYRKGISYHEDDPGDAEAWRLIERCLDSLQNADIAELRRTLGARADQVLAEHGLIVDGDSRDRLLVAIREAERLGAGLLAKRAEGDYSPDPNAARFPALSDSSPDTGVTRIVAAWKAEAAAVRTADSTITKYERILQRFIAFLGHDDARAVTAEDVVRFKDHRLSKEGASAKTIKDGDLAALKSVFAWAVGNKRLGANPAAGVTIKVIKSRKRGYSNDGATAILRAALSRKAGPQERPNLTAALKWAPLLLAHSGARVGEIAQLRKEDVRQVDGVWSMRLTIDAGNIKDREDREVPLHPQVIKLGFVDFVTAARDGYLFLDGVTGARTFRAQHRTLKNRIGDFARGVLREARVPANHGWRHAFITRCRAHGVDLEKRRQITGHVGQGTDETEYGDPAGLYQEICKLPDFDLS
jgi:integrase